MENDTDSIQEIAGFFTVIIVIILAVWKVTDLVFKNVSIVDIIFWGWIIFLFFFSWKIFKMLHP